MGNCPQPVTDYSQTTTDSVDTTGLTIRQGYSFRVMPVDDKPKNVFKTPSTSVKAEVKFLESEVKTEVTPITTKKPVKL